MEILNWLLHGIVVGAVLMVLAAIVGFCVGVAYIVFRSVVDAKP